MISEEEFERLALEERYRLIQEEGDFILTKKEDGLNVHLFTIGGFYVELIQYENEDEIHFIRIVEDEVRLKSFIGEIDLNMDLGI